MQDDDEPEQSSIVQSSAGTKHTTARRATCMMMSSGLYRVLLELVDELTPRSTGKSIHQGTRSQIGVAMCG